MKQIRHTFQDTNTGVRFIINCPGQLTQDQVIRAIRLEVQLQSPAQFREMKRKGVHEFYLLEEATELL